VLEFDDLEAFSFLVGSAEVVGNHGFWGATAKQRTNWSGDRVIAVLLKSSKRTDLGLRSQASTDLRGSASGSTGTVENRGRRIEVT